MAARLLDGKALAQTMQAEIAAGVADLVVELHARDAGLHRHRQVLGRDRNDRIHAAQVDADAALDGEQVSFE